MRLIYIRLFVPLLAALLCVPALAKDNRGQQGEEPLPPGLQKKVERGGRLPPGWQMKLQRGRVLEPDLYRLGEPVSAELRVKLPVGPAGSVEIRLESKIVRINRASHEILDVFDIH